MHRGNAGAYEGAAILPEVADLTGYKPVHLVHLHVAAESSAPALQKVRSLYFFSITTRPDACIFPALQQGQKPVIFQH
ncbi:MAG: hypothetical protein KA780_03825 [Prolixibacteraceae bacterium]|jgi:hypothetical protein|nr:hypothetical protein [Prolixibacteraceae bacterium]